MAYKCGRDSMIFTSLRLLDIDVQGFTGKRTEYLTIPYSSLRCFSVESAGSFDRDSELKIYFRTPWKQRISRDVSRGKADIISIQALIAAKMLGPPGKPSDYEEENTVIYGDRGGMAKLLEYFHNVGHAVDKKEVEKQFKTNAPILQADEKVTQAFKAGRDYYVLTNKRVLVIDVQGLTGKRVEFASYPYKYIKGYSVKSAGTLSTSVKIAVMLDKAWGSVVEQSLDTSTDIFAVNGALATKLLTHSIYQI